MNKIHFGKFKVSVLIGFLFLTGCATRVNYSRMVPSEIDMSDSRNIAIFHLVEETGNSLLPKKLDFWSILSSVTDTLSATIKGDALTMEKRVADYASDLLTESLSNTNYFEIIDPSEVKRLIDGKVVNRGGDAQIGAMLGVDAVVVGTLSRLHYKDSETSVDRFYVDDQGQKKTKTVKRIKREFDFQMNYRVVKTGNGTVITAKSFTDQASDIEDLANKDNLREPETVFKEMVRKTIRIITRQLAPYSVLESVTLKEDKTQDNRMGKGVEFVENQLYSKALTVFLDVWKTTRNEAAGYNASVMYEVEKDLKQSQKMMNEVIDYYPTKKNMQRLARLKRLEADYKKLNMQLDS